MKMFICSHQGCPSADIRYIGRDDIETTTPSDTIESFALGGLRFGCARHPLVTHTYYLDGFVTNHRVRYDANLIENLRGGVYES